MQPFPVPRYSLSQYQRKHNDSPILLYLQHRGNRTKGNEKEKKKEGKISAFATRTKN